jgi:hypothetical protein
MDNYPQPSPHESANQTARIHRLTPCVRQGEPAVNTKNQSCGSVGDRIYHSLMCRLAGPPTALPGAVPNPCQHDRRGLLAWIWYLSHIERADGTVGRVTEPNSAGAGGQIKFSPGYGQTGCPVRPDS